jgi:hypothetical protein
MTIDGQPVKVQNGIARCYEIRQLFFMGTPPYPEEDVLPKERLDIHWERALIPITCNINDEFDFVIKTSEGATITGRAILLIYSHIRVSGGYRIMSAELGTTEPTTTQFKIEGADAQ